MLDADPELVPYEIREERFLLPAMSDTFHGRDVFAPVAAYLARGVDPAEFGPAAANPQRLTVPEPRIWGDQIRGEVIHVDSFGNIVSNISREQFELAVGSRPFRICINGKVIDRLHRAYSDQERGKTLALFGSSDLLEIAVCQGRAERRIGAGKGDTVLVQIEEHSAS
jgi:S-adenosylmethionine hydrolase